MYASAFLLERFGYELVAGQDEVENLAVEVAEGRYATEEIAGWFMEHTSKLEAT